LPPCNLAPRDVAHSDSSFLAEATIRIAAALDGYAVLGIKHVMFEVLTYTPAALARLTEALHIYRGPAELADSTARGGAALRQKRMRRVSWQEGWGRLFFYRMEG
jgi:hypothetical protein